MYINHHPTNFKSPCPSLMADRLSQLQTCLDQLVTQFFSSINFINLHHDLKVPDNSPPYSTKVDDPQLQSLPPNEFNTALEELAKDIVTKAKHIETLINSLPELDNVSTDLVSLENELEEARREQLKASKARDELLYKCDILVRKLSAYKSEMNKT